MKKAFTIFIVFIMLFIYCPTTLGASNPTQSVEYFEDGSYLITFFAEDDTVTRASTVGASKTSYYYSDDDELIWSATLHGTFSYNGSSATCTEASITSYATYASLWEITSAVGTRSGNTAIGTIVAKKYFLGVAIQTVEGSLQISCSPTGVLS